MDDIVIYDIFLLRILIGAIGISLLTAFLGCFVVWKKMSYFGDSLAHSSLLGIAIGTLFAINLNFSILSITILFAILLYFLQNKNILSNDALLGILAHASISIAMIIVSFIDKNFNLEGFLFGSILFIENSDILLIYAILLITCLILFSNWSKFILIIIDSDIASSLNINIKKYQILFTLLMAITVTIAIKITGVLLVTSLLIIPASISKIISKSPNIMCIYASIISVFSTVTGIIISYYFDIIIGPAIISVSIIILLAMLLIRCFCRK